MTYIVKYCSKKLEVCNICSKEYPADKLFLDPKHGKICPKCLEEK